MQEVTRGKLAIVAIDDPGTPGQIVDGRPVGGTPAPNPRMRLFGLVPDGITSITAQSDDGLLRADVHDNAYVLSGHSLTDFHMIDSDRNRLEFALAA